jgi:poly(A) polymerase
LKIVQEWDVPAFPLDGNDLMVAGIKPGKTMGEILDRIEGWWIAQDFKPDKAACLKQI